MNSKKENTQEECETVITPIRQYIAMMKACDQNTLTQMLSIQTSGEETGPGPDFETKKCCDVVTPPTKSKKTPKKKRTTVTQKPPKSKNTTVTRKPPKSKKTAVTGRLSNSSIVKLTYSRLPKVGDPRN